MAHYNEKGEWTWSEDEFRQNLTEKQRQVLHKLDNTENPELIPYDQFLSYEDKYWNEVLIGRQSLQATERAEWIVGGVGVTLIIGGMAALFTWVLTA